MAPRPWLLPVAAIVIAIVWVLWLGRDYVFRGDAAVEVAAPPMLTPSPRDAVTTRPRHDAAAPAAVDRANPKADARGGGAGTAAARGTEPPAEAVQLAFNMPSHSQIGEAFDMRIAVLARQPIGGINLEINYDPTLLKARTLDEMDYAQRAPGEPMFRIDQSSEGHLELSLSRNRQRPEQAFPSNAAVAQFEVLASGRAQVRVAKVVVSDLVGRAVGFSASGRDSDIVLH